MLVFLKLGGSLITDKTRPYSPRNEVLSALASQIAIAVRENSSLHLVLGHGSGSFGHQAASQYGTREGVSGDASWRGFAEVWYQASRLNRLVVEALREVGLPAVTFSAFSSVSARDGQIATWDLKSLKEALGHGLLPVLHGDVVFDTVRGGTILSTEDLFAFLAHKMHPERILLAGLEAGVWDDFPARQSLVREITPKTLDQVTSSLGISTGADVTGGMASKVNDMLRLVEQVANLEVLIFSGEAPGSIKAALRGDNPGTLLHR